MQSPVLCQDFREIQLGFELLEVFFHLGFTPQDFELIGIIEFDGSLQPEEMLGSVVSFQGSDDLFGGCLDSRVFHLDKLKGVSLSGQDRPNDRHSAVAGNVT